MQPADTSPETLPDSELVALLKSGDQGIASTACVELLTRYRPLLKRAWRFVESRVKGEMDEGDFVQEALVRLLSNLGSLRNPLAFPGFFKAVVNSVAVNSVTRHRSDLPAAELVEQFLAGSDPDLDLRLTIESILGNLSKIEQMVVRSSVLEGVSAREGARRLGLSPSGFRSIKSKSISKLRKIMLDQADALKK